jgi:transcriptional regulator with XRE-family HTH domain/Zn-dependent peptidase ImmA (M78 family)
MSIPERIRLARRLARLSQQQLAEAAGVTKQSISKYERGVATPTSGVLGALAVAANVTVDFLMRPTEVRIGELHFRKLQRLGAADQHALEAHAQDCLERQLTLERIVYGDKWPCYMGPRGLDIRSGEAAESAAEQCRSKFDLGSDPIANLTDLLETLCVRIITVPTHVEDFDGMSHWVNEDVPFIIVADSPSRSGDRLRFTVAHEFAHLLCRYPSSWDRRLRETASHRFAGALLAPRKALISELGGRRSHLEWRELLRLKLVYGISMGALLYRCRDSGIIQDVTFDRLWKEYGGSGWNRRDGGSEPGHVCKEAPAAVDRLLDRALAESLISAARAAELCGLSGRAFEERRALRMLDDVCCPR